MLLKWKGWFIWVEQPDYSSSRQSGAAVPDSHLKTIYFKTLTGGVSCCLFKGSHCFKHYIFKRWCIIYLSVVCFTVFRDTGFYFAVWGMANVSSFGERVYFYELLNIQVQVQVVFIKFLLKSCCVHVLSLLYFLNANVTEETEEGSFSSSEEKSTWHNSM